MSRLSTIKQILNQNNQPKYRFDQLTTSIYQKAYQKYSDIPGIPSDLKQQIIEQLGEEILTIQAREEIEGDNAHKVLFQTRDGHHLESVRLQYKSYASLCISSQAGCALACTFCATGAIGLKKNLTEDEIVDQVLWFQKRDLHIDRIIFMGMGEPLGNPLNTFDALRTIVSPKLLGISTRRVSVSTVGIVPMMAKLTDEFPNVNLAFSLHSPFLEERKSLMPITKAYSIEKVFQAIDYHLEKTNHKVFISYILLKELNDTPAHAQAVADLIKLSPDRLNLCHLNLIRYNSGGSLTTYDRPDRETIDRFMEILEKNHLHYTLRQDFGLKIKAACGQLAANY